MRGPGSGEVLGRHWGGRLLKLRRYRSAIATIFGAIGNFDGVGCSLSSERAGRSDDQRSACGSGFSQPKLISLSQRLTVRSSVTLLVGLDPGGEVRGVMPVQPCVAYLRTYRKTQELTGAAGRIEMPEELKTRLRELLLEQLDQR
jgi:hypothetical protein